MIYMWQIYVVEFHRYIFFLFFNSSPTDGAATATAAAKAVAVAAAVSVDHNSSDLMDDNTSGVIYMNDARTKAASHDCKGQDPK